MNQKYKVLRVKSHLISGIKLAKMIDTYFKQFVKIANSIDSYTYIYFKKSISDKRLIKIYNEILK